MNELYYGNKKVFEHKIYNACIGQAKYFYRHEKMQDERFMIIDDVGVKHDVNEYTLKYEK